MDLGNQVKTTEKEIYKDLQNELVAIGKEIYEKVSAYVQANKGDDDKLYRSAILRLSDGRKMFVDFDEQGVISTGNIKFDEEGNKIVYCYGLQIYSYTTDGYGFTVIIGLQDPNKARIQFIASEKGYPYNAPGNDFYGTEKEKEAIKSYLEQVHKQIPTLEYDKEATHSVDNFTKEARKEYNIQQFNEKMRELSETNPDSKVLPSVETAINWLLNHYVLPQTSVNETQIFAFRESLSKSLMDELSKGIEPQFLFMKDFGHPQGMLADAMVKSGISGTEDNFHAILRVSANSVGVRIGNYASSLEETLINEVQEEKKERSI